VADYLGEYAASRGKGETVVVSQLDRSCPCLRITGGRSQVARDSSVAAELRHLGVLENKHIPQEYLLNSKAMRLRLLAGLIDSDGHYDRRGKNGAYEIAMIDQQLVEQIKFLCDSLGYRTSISDRISRSQNGYEVRSWRVYFNGNVDEIPTKIMRKQATAWTSNVNWTLSRITLQQDKVDDYYGFAIDGDRLFLLEDGTVTHNTIKGEMILEHNAKRGLRSGLYNFELNRTVMLDRRAVRHAQYDRRSFKQGLLTEAQIAQLDEETPLWVKPEDRQGLGDWQKLSRQLRKALDEANARMKGWAGAIDYWFTPGWDIDKLCATIYAEHMQNPYNLVAVDYLEKIQPSARQRKLFGTNKLDREEDNVEQLKTLAEKLRIPLLVLSQLSKAGRAKNAEDMDGTEVRGAGAKTERSNINVLFSIDKGDDAVPDPSIKDGVMLSVAITKNTMGSCGTFRMFRNGARFTIHDTTKQELDA
jgi:replicative DNA helicase